MVRGKSTKTVKADGITIVLNTDFAKSWAGVRQAKDLQELTQKLEQLEPGSPEYEKVKTDMMVKTINYYSNIIENQEDLDDVPAEKLFAIVTNAIQSDSESKN